MGVADHSPPTNQPAGMVAAVEGPNGRDAISPQSFTSSDWCTTLFSSPAYRSKRYSALPTQAGHILVIELLAGLGWDKYMAGRSDQISTTGQQWFWHLSRSLNGP